MGCINTFHHSSVLYTKLQFSKATSVSIEKRVVESQPSMKNHCDKNIGLDVN